MQAPAPTAPAPLLQARGLAFARNEEPVFGPLDFRLDAGEALLVRGGNGAGKTTLLRVLAGLLAATAGTVALDGRAVDPAHLARGCAFLGHLPGHKADLGALDNLRYALGIAASRPGIDPQRALREVGLAGHEDTHARRLSAGQNKRLALARLRVSAARLWLLDEPYANLDLDGIALVDRLLAAHVAEGGGALLTTHGAYAAPPVPIRTLELA
jgi:heme exporter protein A